MTDNLSTHLDRPYAWQPATRAAAMRVVGRQDEADLLLAMLGLVEKPEVEQAATHCALCGNKLPSHGVCRKAQRCRAAAREAGCSA